MLKLMALDEEDLGVFSFHLHNARLYGRDMLRQKRSRNFVLALRRFDWEAAIAEAESGQAAEAGSGAAAAAAAVPGQQKAPPATTGKAPPKPQAATGAAMTGAAEIPVIVQFDHVLAVRSYGIDRRQSGQVLSLKGLCFRPATPPGGIITFLFAEKAGLELKVECIEARLQDLPATAL